MARPYMFAAPADSLRDRDGYTASGAVRRELQSAKDDEGHVVALGRAGGEGVSGFHDFANGIFCGEAVAARDGFEEARVAPFFEVWTHGFTEAVGIDNQQIAG